jgi:hypothetical protein
VQRPRLLEVESNRGDRHEGQPTRGCVWFAVAALAQGANQTQAEGAVLRKACESGQSWREIAEALPGRSSSAVTKRGWINSG